jgi:hypothetical protein
VYTGPAGAGVGAVAVEDVIAGCSIGNRGVDAAGRGIISIRSAGVTIVAARYAVIGADVRAGLPWYTVTGRIAALADVAHHARRALRVTDALTALFDRIASARNTITGRARRTIGNIDVRARTNCGTHIRIIRIRRAGIVVVANTRSRRHTRNCKADIHGLIAN